MMDKLLLERPPEALHRGIVVAVPFPGHRRQEALLFQPLLVLQGTVLASSIRVVDQARGGVLVAHGLR